eukprot:gene8774-8953_t
MFARRKAAKRFSLLLLEDEEDYIADWVASCKWPDAVEGNWQRLACLPGRLRLCTRSLFFEPDDVRVPIVRLDFNSVVQLEAEGMQALAVGVTKVTKMKPSTAGRVLVAVELNTVPTAAGSADVPYVVERNCTSTWHFSLTYAKLDSFMPLAQEQLVISRLPTADRLSLLAASAKAREDASQFDSSRLVEYSEHLAWEGPAIQLTPLVREPGRLAVTDQRLYFQPLHNIAGNVPVRSHPLAAVAAVVRRRSSLRPVGLELFLLQLRQLGSEAESGSGPHQARPISGGPFWDTPSVFFSFRSEADRDKALSALTRQPALGAAVNSLVPVTPGEAAGGISRTVPGQQSQLVAAGQLLEAAGGWLGRVMSAWQQGKVSNFDYLLYLNLAAGRSFNDLAQWPVFPWVLRDYQSRELDLSNVDVFRKLDQPMGAQTHQRLEVFRQRYQEMESLVQHVGSGHDMPAPFMYGTHYSTPGYVMYWLVRAAPGHMLRLQGGRLFVSLKEAWHSATTSTTDVKELIPEFYMPGADFLVNGSQLALGIRQSGKPVHDVELPPWASSPAHLLAMHRAALEAPYVSAHLHQWIDLIFGFKQTGVAAVEADNVFFHLTYEGAVDISQTILAAAAPDIQPTVIAGPDAGGANSSVGRAEDDALLSLSPVHSGDLLSASFSSSTPDLIPEPRCQDKGAAGSSKPTPPSGTRISQATAVERDPRQPEHQQQQRQPSTGLMGVLSKLKDGAAAAAAGTVASVLPSNGAAATASKGSSLKLSLSWMQQQFAEGMALKSTPSASRSGAGQGSCVAHEDGVSCLVQLGSSGGAAGSTRLATGAYDCSVKVWDVAEGRQPWSSSLAQPLAALELRDFDSGVWALSSSGSGQLLVSGSEEGQVAAWDLRTGQQIWATQLKDLLMATYFSADHVVWAFQIGLITDKKVGERSQKVSLYSWALGSVCTMILEASAILRVSSRRVPGESDADWTRRQEAARQEVNQRLLVFIHGFVQALTAVGLLQLYPFKPRTVGLFGSIASALNCYFLLPPFPQRAKKQTAALPAGVVSPAVAGDAKLVAKIA